MGGKNENYLCLKKMVLITLKSIDYNIKNIFKGKKMKIISNTVVITL